VFGCVLENTDPQRRGLVFHAPELDRPAYNLQEAPGLAFLQEGSARYDWRHEVRPLPNRPGGVARVSITWRWFRADWITAGGPRDGLPLTPTARPDCPGGPQPKRKGSGVKWGGPRPPHRAPPPARRTHCPQSTARGDPSSTAQR
jgi:hypothetical protein